MLRLVFCVVAMIVGSIVLGHGCGQSSSKPVELISGDSQAKDLEKELEARIAKKMSNPELLQQVVGLFLVQIPEIPDSHGCAFLIDRQGAVRHRFDCQVLSARNTAKTESSLPGKTWFALRQRAKSFGPFFLTRDSGMKRAR